MKSYDQDIADDPVLQALGRARARITALWGAKKLLRDRFGAHLVGILNSLDVVHGHAHAAAVSAKLVADELLCVEREADHRFWERCANEGLIDGVGGMEWQRRHAGTELVSDEWLAEHRLIYPEG
jgi:hypothetical protein